jgi:hypothetical protein
VPAEGEFRGERIGLHLFAQVIDRDPDTAETRQPEVPEKYRPADPGREDGRKAMAVPAAPTAPEVEARVPLSKFQPATTAPAVPESQRALSVADAPVMAEVALPTVVTSPLSTRRLPAFPAASRMLLPSSDRPPEPTVTTDWRLELPLTQKRLATAELLVAMSVLVMPASDRLPNDARPPEFCR